MRVLKEIVEAIIVLALVLAPPIIGGTIQTTYTMTAEVVSADYGTIAIVDETGELFAFCGDGFSVGDKVKVRFNTNFTDSTREDDEVRKVWKSF